MTVKHLCCVGAIVMGLAIAPAAQSQTSDAQTACAQLLSVLEDEWSGITLTPQQAQQLDQLDADAERQYRSLLTPAQQQQSDQLIDAYDAQLQAILTPAQWQQWEQDEDLSQPLTQQQMVQLEQLEASHWQAFDATLTPDQIAKIDAQNAAYEEALQEVLTADQVQRLAQNQFLQMFPEFQGVSLQPEQREQLQTALIQQDDQWEALLPDLTPEQDQQWIDLEQQYDEAVLALLTAQQRQQWDAGVEVPFTAAQDSKIDQLDQQFLTDLERLVPQMTPEKWIQIETLEAQSEEQITKLLTPDQKQQVEENWEHLETASCFEAIRLQSDGLN